ncbi:SsrA-binding protein [Mycoplasmopsis bovirhinis]|uniref:SsrA-binding protein n=1 Tax=Mycoplasmopsis bovirhinis TaxID=29553 RepID=A0A449ACX7_9BACT|nr:SsrA-binding protein [Mycoplasmopsis bovirhinis]VEU62897.1 SsrA RNA (tmRNA)-binding protein [Mycoplasmopsis bovirhinis]
MKIITTNKNSYRDYEILEKFEAGLALEGWEVKSARAAEVSLTNSFCSIYKNELWLKDAFFKQYMQVKCNETKDRKLLMHKHEIRKLKFKLESQPLTLIPLKLYFNKESTIKIELALVRGLKKYDKRAKLAKEEADKRILKTLKNY